MPYTKGDHKVRLAFKCLSIPSNAPSFVHGNISLVLDAGPGVSQRNPQKHL